MKRKSYCKGVLCRRTDRKHKCVDCSIYVCGKCSIPITKNKVSCLDCFVGFHLNEVSYFYPELDITKIINEDKKGVDL